jgi:hypothetical protein
MLVGAHVGLLHHVLRLTPFVKDGAGCTEDSRVVSSQQELELLEVAREHSRDESSSASMARVDLSIVQSAVRAGA